MQIDNLTTYDFHPFNNELFHCRISAYTICFLIFVQLELFSDKWKFYALLVNVEKNNFHSSKGQSFLDKLYFKSWLHRCCIIPLPLILHAIQFTKPYLDTFLCKCNSNALKTENQTILVLGNCQHVIPPFI